MNFQKLQTDKNDTNHIQDLYSNPFQSELQRALKWFQNAILVQKLHSAVKIQDITDKIPEYQKFTTVFVQVGFRIQMILKKCSDTRKTSEYGISK